MTSDLREQSVVARDHRVDAEVRRRMGPLRRMDLGVQRVVPKHRADLSTDRLRRSRARSPNRRRRRRPARSRHRTSDGWTRASRTTRSRARRFDPKIRRPSDHARYPEEPDHHRPLRSVRAGPPGARRRSPVPRNRRSCHHPVDTPCPRPDSPRSDAAAIERSRAECRD